MSDFRDEYREEIQDCYQVMQLAAKYDPLTAEQELLLIDLYYYRVRPMIYFLAEAKCYSLLLYELVRLSTMILHQFILRNLRLVIKIAKKFMGRGIPLIDLIFEGIAPLGTKRSGLIYAIRDKYDPTKGFKISTYITWWIRQAVSRHIENKSRLVKLSQNVLGLASKIDTVYRDFTIKYNGERPEPEDIAFAVNARWPNTNITAEQVSKIGRQRWTHISLNDESEDSGAMLEFLTYDENLESQIEVQADRDYIFKDLLAKLEPLERNLIIWKFGLIDYNSKRTNKEIAYQLNIDPKDYKKLETKAMSRLRELADKDKINLEL